MHLKNWIIHKSPNQIALLLVSPLILALCLLLIFGSKDPQVLLWFLWLTVLFQFTAYLLYTQTIGILLIESNIEQSAISKKKLNRFATISIGLLTASCISIVWEMPSGILLLPLVGVFDLIRFHYLSKLLIQCEGHETKNIWTYLATLWIFLNPLVGIWPLHKRVYNTLRKG